MVTWLHFWQIYCDAMDSAVTNMVTNGYIGYKRFRSIEINLIQHIEYRFLAIFRIQLS